jgi:asparagine synthase (glutamine-hydrolysing)
MCGIFGLIQTSPLISSELSQMSILLRHRGPDDEGFIILNKDNLSCFAGADTPSSVLASNISYTPRLRLVPNFVAQTGGVVLGHRRLSIIDLSEHGHQPMSYKERYWITYNGEVYNYLELRAELQALGYAFTTESDTEVILAAYAHWGPACLSRFNGMWSMAILDKFRKTLFLARDRFGVKPLYLYQTQNRLAFASEIKAFAALSGWRARINTERLLDFLVWNACDHTDETMFARVRQLPAGHYLEFDIGWVFMEKQSPDVRDLYPVCWYSLENASIAPISGIRATEQLRAVMEDAVRLRMRADVTVGSCLSGGLDSSSIVCLMARQLAAHGSNLALHTFTACSHDAQYDESAYAQAVIHKISSHAFYVTPEPEQLFKNLDRLTWHQDEPFLSTSIFAQWCVFEEARKNGVIVMLDGQGADEILCGYRGFFGAYLAGLLRRRQVGRWLSELGAMRREINFGPMRSIGYTAAYLMPEFTGLLGRFDGRAYSDKNWLRPCHRGVYAKDPIRHAGGRTNSVRGMSLAQITATNLPMLLHWEDRNSMAFSVEARVPFLDYRLVELCLSIADEDKLGLGISKSILRRAMRGIVPDTVLDRRDKMGFVTAEKFWVTRDLSTKFRAELQAALEIFSGIIDPVIVKRFDNVVAGQRPFDHRYWRVISAGRWAQSFGVSD